MCYNGLMNKQQLLEYVKNFCDAHNIDFKEFPSELAYTVMTSDPCAGFFEHNDKIKATLGIGRDLPEETFYEVLAHEFGHAQQFIENSPYWSQAKLSESEVETYSKLMNRDLTGMEVGDLFHFWVEKEVELCPIVVEDLVRRTTEVEFDCERRVLKLAKELNLNLDSQVYAQKANAYLITYFFAHKTRQFTTPGMATYRNAKVLEKMPKVIDPEFCANIDSELIELIKKECIKEAA